MLQRVVNRHFRAAERIAHLADTAGEPLAHHVPAEKAQIRIIEHSAKQKICAKEHPQHRNGQGRCWVSINLVEDQQQQDPIAQAQQAEDCIKNSLGQYAASSRGQRRHMVKIGHQGLVRFIISRDRHSFSLSAAKNALSCLLRANNTDPRYHLSSGNLPALCFPVTGEPAKAYFFPSALKLRGDFCSAAGGFSPAIRSLNRAKLRTAPHPHHLLQ